MRDREGLDMAMICSVDGRVVNPQCRTRIVDPYSQGILHIMLNSCSHLNLLCLGRRDTQSLQRSRPIGLSCALHAMDYGTPCEEGLWRELAHTEWLDLRCRCFVRPYLKSMCQFDHVWGLVLIELLAD